MGLRHGPMAALDKTTLLVAFLASDERVARLRKRCLQELMQKRLVKTQIAVGGSPSCRWMVLQSAILRQTFAQRFQTIVGASDVLFGQLLGLFFSLRCN